MAYVRVACLGNPDFTDDENLRWAWLRAVEWAAWPAFLSQPLLPPLYLYFPVWKVVVVVFCASILWSALRYRFVSAGLATAACLYVRAKWITIPVCAIIAIYERRFLVAAAIALVPLYAGLLGLPAKTGVLQQEFMRRLGYMHSEDTEAAST